MSGLLLRVGPSRGNLLASRLAPSVHLHSRLLNHNVQHPVTRLFISRGFHGSREGQHESQKINWGEYYYEMCEICTMTGAIAGVLKGDQEPPLSNRDEGMIERAVRIIPLAAKGFVVGGLTGLAIGITAPIALPIALIDAVVDLIYDAAIGPPNKKNSIEEEPGNKP